VKSGISTDKGKRIAHHTNHKGQSLRWPSAIVHKGREDLFAIPMRAQNDKRNKDRKEAQDMQD
jgi:hypothetical protein